LNVDISLLSADVCLDSATEARRMDAHLPRLLTTSGQIGRRRLLAVDGARKEAAGV
jgi:hypothetical protein